MGVADFHDLVRLLPSRGLIVRGAELLIAPFARSIAATTIAKDLEYIAVVAGELQSPDATTDLRQHCHSHMTIGENHRRHLGQSPMVLCQPVGIWPATAFRNLRQADSRRRLFKPLQQRRRVGAIAQFQLVILPDVCIAAQLKRRVPQGHASHGDAARIRRILTDCCLGPVENRGGLGQHLWTIQITLRRSINPHVLGGIPANDVVNQINVLADVRRSRAIVGIGEFNDAAFDIEVLVPQQLREQIRTQVLKFTAAREGIALLVHTSNAMADIQLQIRLQHPQVRKRLCAVRKVDGIVPNKQLRTDR